MGNHQVALAGRTVKLFTDAHMKGLAVVSINKDKTVALRTRK